ncbi:hypothetical protein BN1708_018862, partial [Verticillium longisporum]
HADHGRRDGPLLRPCLRVERSLRPRRSRSSRQGARSGTGPLHPGHHCRVQVAFHGAH